MPIYATTTETKTVGETRNVAVSFVGRLDSGELLTGTPTIVEVTTTDLTLSSKAVNTAALTINGESVAIGKALQFSVAGGTAGTTYEIKLTCATDATPAQTVIGRVKLKVDSD